MDKLFSSVGSLKSNKSGGSSGTELAPESRFFVLKKDSQRRETLARIMRESHEDIVASWLETLCKDAGECSTSPALNPENLSKILAGLEIFIVDKDTAKLNAMLMDIKEDLEYEITHLNQLRLAMFLFQDTVCISFLAS